MHETTHASVALATRSARAAACSAAAGPSGSRQTHSLIDLRKGGCEGGARATKTCAPLPPTMVDVAVEQVRMGGGVGKLGRFGAGDTPSPAHLRVLLEAEAGVLQNRVAKDLGEGEPSIQTWAGSRRAIKPPSRCAAYVNATAQWAHRRPQPAGRGHQV